MNSLNSVLIEGHLTVDPVRVELEKGRAQVSFAIESTRYFNQDNERMARKSRFNIEAFGSTAELCFKALGEGNGVRVVGRLEEEGGKVWITAEHVEFKAKFDRRKPVEA